MFLLVMFLLWSRSSEKILYALCLTIWRYRSVATFISLEFLWCLTSDVLFLPIFNKTTKMLFHQFFIYRLYIFCLYTLYTLFIYFDLKMSLTMQQHLALNLCCCHQWRRKNLCTHCSFIVSFSCLKIKAINKKTLSRSKQICSTECL